MPLTKQDKLKKLLKIYQTSKDGNVALLRFILEIEDRLDKEIPELNLLIEAVKNKKELISELDLEQTDKEAVELGYSFSQPFVMQKMPEHIIPVHVATEDGSTYTSKDFKKLVKFLDEITEQHNKKADEYNKKIVF